MIATLAGEGLVSVLLVGAVCGIVYLLTVLTAGRRYLPHVTVPLVVVLNVPMSIPLSIFFGIPALVLGGIGTFASTWIDTLRGRYRQVLVIASLVAVGLVSSWILPFLPPVFILFPGIAMIIVSTIVFYPLVQVFFQGTGKEYVFFFSSSAAIVSFFAWSFAMALGGAGETTLSGIRSLVVQSLSPYPLSIHFVYTIANGVEVSVVMAIILGCIIIAEYLGRTRLFEAMKKKILKRARA